LLAHDSRVKVIILSGQEDKKNSLRAVGEGAYDFLCEPPGLDELKVILKRACHVATKALSTAETRVVRSPKGHAALSRSTSVKPPALPEVADISQLRFSRRRVEGGFPPAFWLSVPSLNG